VEGASVGGGAVVSGIDAGATVVSGTLTTGTSVVTMAEGARSDGS